MARLAELGERLLGRPAGVLPGIDGDQEGTLDRRDEVDHAIASGAHTKQHTGRTHSFCNAEGCIICRMTHASGEDMTERNGQEMTPKDDQRVSSIEEREAAAEIEPQSGRHPDNDGETVEE